ncbi:hypothetical protein HHI36_014901 [Cryptolaemus montrouzieri]|uniref:Uncharacterized protein n=1 Tax=Cryptolaemus montrouzieri TaxID=559131 RepID=A0ABD2N4H3_9CUCU
MAGINGLVIYQLNNPQIRSIRRKYLQEVWFELVKLLTTTRISQEHIPRAIKLKARLLLGLQYMRAQNMPIQGGKARCDFYFEPEIAVPVTNVISVIDVFVQTNKLLHVPNVTII